MERYLAAPCSPADHQEGQRDMTAVEVSGQGPAVAPIVFSVPHAGRDYPASVLARSRLPVDVLQRLEDRYADLLVTELVAAGHVAVVAKAPRAVIDLNRNPRDIDVCTVSGIPRGLHLVQSPKQRGGLGLFPRFLPRVGDLWTAPLGWEEAESRIRLIHAAYHAEIERQIDRIAARYGQALLLDVHSMPPLTSGGGAARADIVIGDRFGVSASPRLADIARATAQRHGLAVAVNHPYPGYYLIERHGRPKAGRHALQIEISRDLYLDDALDGAGPGLPAIHAMLADVTEALAEELTRGDFAVAAE